jgi:hypothetical protein
MNEAKKQTLIKLERDFERVQATAQSCRARVTRQQKQYQQRGGANNADLEQNSAANALHQEQERFQVQIQEDVSKKGMYTTSRLVEGWRSSHSPSTYLRFAHLLYYFAETQRGNYARTRRGNSQH